MMTYLQDCVDAVIDNRGVTPHKRNTEWKNSGIMVLSANNVKTTGFTIYFANSGNNKHRQIMIPQRIFIEKYSSFEKIILGQRLYGLKVKKPLIQNI